ncbi:MAG: sulfurtransferase [Betaproteobacteria bacterium]
MLITTEELSAHLDDPQWIVFDCRHDLFDIEKGERVYRENHIPGAHFANMDTELSGEKNGSNGRHPLPSPNAFAAFLARHGVGPNSTIVAYDDVGGQFASRLWWMARWIGLRNVNLLDGGIQKWIAENRPLSKNVPVPQPVALRAEPDALMLWSAPEVQAHIGDSQFALIDARAAERYRGEVEPIDPVAGHIPGALNRFFKQNLNADQTMRPAEELAREFESLANGVAPENTVHQCGSGVTACMNIFAMEYAGLKGAKLYAGSWSEWVSDPSRPVVLKEGKST